MQDLEPSDYRRKKEEVADALVRRLEAFLPGLHASTVYREVSLMYCFQKSSTQLLTRLYP